MSMRDQSRSAAAEEGSQIDLTPMLDVVFIMLIFFIVTSSFGAMMMEVSEICKTKVLITDKNTTVIFFLDNYHIYFLDFPFFLLPYFSANPSRKLSAIAPLLDCLARMRSLKLS